MPRDGQRSWFVGIGPGLGAVGRVARRELGEAICASGDALGREEEANRRVDVKLDPGDLAAEGYRITSKREGDRLVLTCAGQDNSGVVYASYDLAARIRHGEPLEGLDVREEPYYTMRRIHTTIPDHEALERLTREMPRWRMNALCLFGSCHAPAGRPGLLVHYYDSYISLPISYRNYPQVHEGIESSCYYQKTKKSFRKLVRTAKEHGVGVFCHFGILAHVPIDDAGPHWASCDPRDVFPELFLPGKGVPDWDSAALWQYVRDQLEELFELYPEMAGVNVCSDEMESYNLGHVLSYGSIEDRRRWIGRMVEGVEEVCARYGKLCYWYLHGCGALYVDTLKELGESRPGGLRLCAESGPIDAVLSDKYPCYQFDKVAAAGDGMFEHDGVIQYAQAFPWLPNILDRYVVRHVREATQAGLRGGGATWWLDGPYYSPMNSLSAANIELFGRLLWSPDEPLDDIWNRWVRRRFGERAAPAAGHLLRSTQEVLNGIFFFNNLNAYFWFDFGFVGQANYMNYEFNLDLMMRANNWYEMIEYFQPEGTPLYANPWNAACRERTIPMSQMRREKQTAIRQAEGLLDHLTKHQGDFEETDYYMLLPRYVTLLYYARAGEQLVEALYNFTNLHIRAYDPECVEPRQGMERATAALEGIYLEMLGDGRLRYFEPDVFVYGLRAYFMDRMMPILRDLQFYDRVLSAPEEISSLPADEQEKAQRILSDAAFMRDKYERNARGEVNVEEEWAKVLGDAAT